MTSKELKPCPFCGSEELVTYYDGIFIECKTCNVTVIFHNRTREKIIEAWNRRANNDKQSRN